MQKSQPSILTIKGKTYKILRILSQGSLGKVFLAEIDGCQYTIREQNQIIEHEWNFSQFMATLKFKNLVNLLAVEQNNYGKIYMVMEYCNISLYDQIQQQSLEASKILYILKEIANGIKELHSIGTAHRDLKPENILIQKIPNKKGQEQERYKIFDFGTVKEKERFKTKQVGAPYYLAPEQLEGADNYSTKADIWSFGALCYELLTKKPLFDGITVQEIEQKIKELKIAQEIDKLRHLDKDYVDLMKKMLQRNPNDRCDIHVVISTLKSSTRLFSQVEENKQEISKTVLTKDPIQQKQQQVQDFKPNFQPPTFNPQQRQAQTIQQCYNSNNVNIVQSHRQGQNDTILQNNQQNQNRQLTPPQQARPFFSIQIPESFQKVLYNNQHQNKINFSKDFSGDMSQPILNQHQLDQKMDQANLKIPQLQQQANLLNIPKNVDSTPPQFFSNRGQDKKVKPEPAIGNQEERKQASELPIQDGIQKNQRKQFVFPQKPPVFAPNMPLNQAQGKK